MHLVGIRTTWFTQQKQRSLYQNKVTSSLVAIQRPGHWADTVKWPIKAACTCLDWPNSWSTTFCYTTLSSLCTCIRACDGCDDLEKTNPWILIIMVLYLRSPELCTEIRVDSLSGLLLSLALMNLLLAHNIRFYPIYKLPTSTLYYLSNV